MNVPDAREIFLDNLKAIHALYAKADGINTVQILIVIR